MRRHEAGMRRLRRTPIACSLRDGRMPILDDLSSERRWPIWDFVFDVPPSSVSCAVVLYLWARACPSFLAIGRAGCESCHFLVFARSFAGPGDHMTRPMDTRFRWLAAGLFLATLATLVLEVLDTRLLSVLTWYHLSFLAVSLAMLGMAAGAVSVFLGGSRFVGDGVTRALPRYALWFALAIPSSHLVNLSVPIPFLRQFVAMEVRGARRRDRCARGSLRALGYRGHAGPDADGRPDRPALRRGSLRRGARLPGRHRPARVVQHHVGRLHGRRLARPSPRGASPATPERHAPGVRSPSPRHSARLPS